MEMTKIFYCVTCAPILGFCGAWFVARYGMKLSIIDRACERSSHSGNIPKGGGVGILIAFIFVSVLLGMDTFFWIPAVCLSLVSLMGDMVDLPVFLRLLVQMLCSTIALTGYFFPVTIPYYFLFPGFIFFMVGTANIYNFMDGINGIAGITSVVAFGLIAVYAHTLGAGGQYVILAVSIALSSLAFLYFNLPAARVFMGDVGSVMLGFVFALVVIGVARNLLDFFCMAGFLFLFYMDELTTMAVRVKNKESLTKAHRRHVYQLLANEIGVAHWKVSIGYGLFQLVIGLSIVFLRPYGIVPVFLLYAACSIVFVKVSCIIREKV